MEDSFSTKRKYFFNSIQDQVHKYNSQYGDKKIKLIYESKIGSKHEPILIDLSSSKFPKDSAFSIMMEASKTQTRINSEIKKFQDKELNKTILESKELKSDENKKEDQEESLIISEIKKDKDSEKENSDGEREEIKETKFKLNLFGRLGRFILPSKKRYYGMLY